MTKRFSYWIFACVVFVVVLRLFFAFGFSNVWWDSGVYIGMGKFIFSAGDSGLFEHIRPPLLPIVLGFIWKVGFNPVFFGSLLEILLMGGIVWFTGLIAKEWFSKKVGLIAAVFVGLSPIFFNLSFQLYTEIPAVFFILFSIWLVIKKKYLLAGAFGALAFLTKFPAGLFFAILFLVLFLRKEWVAWLKLSVGFGILTLPYFIWSWVVYGSFFATLIAAKETISLALGCNVLRAKPWWQYGWLLLFSESKIHIFSIVGVIALVKKWKKKYLLFVLCLIIPVIYFAQLQCRDYRYLTMFLPFVSMLSALGIVFLIDLFKDKRQKIFVVVLAIVVVVLLYSTFTFYFANKTAPSIQEQEYFKFVETKNISGDIWVANPLVAVYTDKPLRILYYPIYNSNLSRFFEEYLVTDEDTIGAVLLDNCGGGIICPPNDLECDANTKRLVSRLDNRMNLVFNQSRGRCWYKVWVTS